MCGMDCGRDGDGHEEGLREAGRLLIFIYFTVNCSFPLFFAFLFSVL